MLVDLVVVGGGAAGFFAAITCAEQSSKSVVIVEKTAQVLQKVKISGGGRCNVTHDCPDPRELSGHYPRGGRALIGPFHRFDAVDTIDWFTARGLALKTEDDGRVFPVTDDSQTIIDALIGAADAAGVTIRRGDGVASIVERDGAFDVETDSGARYRANNVLIATGGTRSTSGARLAERLGHDLLPATPSLFTFKIQDPRLQGLLGLSVTPAKVRIEHSDLRSDGPVLITHWGLSGPGILKISAWGARELAQRGYRFDVVVNWLPGVDVAEVIAGKRRTEGKRQLAARSPFPSIPKRLWARLLSVAGVEAATNWAELGKQQAARLVEELTAARFSANGKSTNKDEFVTCGGVSLDEIDFKTMESKLVPGLFFAGEVMDVDGVTGGFNFQHAWTSGFHAGSAVAAR